ncbi:hypothetical protein J6590_012943 [Homalodisca vitripennis]|nr:hypothetical protein J6590_093582 [Homalodisca vitripennis]KAG8322950.1 hypothetical protein J6590_012943 [Homalodisca vitripennis]
MGLHTISSNVNITVDIVSYCSSGTTDATIYDAAQDTFPAILRGRIPAKLSAAPSNDWCLAPVDAEMGSVLRDTADIAAPRPSGICSGNIEKTSQNLSYNNMISVHNIGPVDAEMGSVLRDTATSQLRGPAVYVAET